MLTELAAEAGAIVVYLVGSALLALVGLVAGYNSLQHVVSGDLITGAWLAFMGGLALFAGVLLARRKLLDPWLAA